MTSELSNALNPHIVTARRHRPHHVPDLIQYTPEQPREYVPHRSELELAIAEPPPPPPLAPVCAQVPRPGVNAVHELLRVFTATKEAADIERRRRQAWELEQEAKYTKRQAEMEQEMLEMRQEISVLKAYISLHPSVTTPDGNAVPSTARIDAVPQTIDPIPPISEDATTPLPLTLVTTVIEAPPPQLPTFIEGSSSEPLTHAHVFQHSRSENIQHLDVPWPDSSISTSPSPTLQSSDASRPPTSASSRNSRKRQSRTSRSVDGHESSSDESSGSPVGDRPLKRANGHDGRCLTIHHAMRSHIIRMMKLPDDKNLPDSHVEGEELTKDDPVRFVWDKTPKQSTHNAAMRMRVVADLKANRCLYKYVPEKDFGKKNLETLFDQAFTTMRQKFKVQRNADAAEKLKRREDMKARSARRISRKKVKLTNRIDTRKKLEAFSHATFDGALQQDCMSSEESSEESVDPATSADGRDKIQVLRIRGLPWRSLRLQRLYATLDVEERAGAAQKPKRGVGRKERCMGPHKDGFLIPPKGVSSWMISHRWIHAVQISQPDLLESLKDLVVDPPGFDWNQFLGLGAESDDDPEPEDTDQYIPRSDASYSLQYALTPMP
ncbi:hypothetical protein B0H21DRAFT_783446 [Amylocystis lapponica]|nr:hypothetical protein B0H21DRAFT_783446 [Amylocystis lapponica]